MQLQNRIRSFLIDKNYYIDIYDEEIHVFHYIDILKLQSDEIILQMDGFRLILMGEDFRVKRLENQEILIQGMLENLKMER